jgi:hypothetical protein
MSLFENNSLHHPAGTLEKHLNIAPGQLFHICDAEINLTGLF